MARPPWRVRDRATFDRLRRSGLRARSGPLTVIWVPPSPSLAGGDVADGAAGAGPVDSEPRVAFAIARRVGSAVVRNRVRRRLRAVLADLVTAPGAYLVSVGPEAAHLSSSELRAAASEALATLAGRRS